MAIPVREQVRKSLPVVGIGETDIETEVANIRGVVLKMMMDNTTSIISQFRSILDYIDESMSSDQVLRDCLQHWRDVLGY